MKQLYPTSKQANLMFLSISAAILFGSGLLAPKLGLGTNLWINEYLWILAPSVLLVKLGKMPAKEVFKLQRTSGKNLFIAGLASASLWFFSAYLSKVTGMFLDSEFGALDAGSVTNDLSANQSVLLLLGMLFLAPVCEELLFRGVIQSAYEAHNKQYGFIASAVLFGMFHVMNGVTEVIPTFFAGLMLGYLVYCTGSIAASMSAHFAFNASALFINGSLGLSSLKSIPLWLHIVSIGGFLMALLLLSRLQPAEGNTEGNAEGILEAADAPVITKYSAGSIVLFALSGLFVVAVGAAELYVRLRL